MSGRGNRRRDDGRDRSQAAAAARQKLAIAADPTLRSIVDRLLIEPASAAEIAASLDLDAQAVRHHLRKLVRIGVAERQGKSQRRGVSEFLYACRLDRTFLSAVELSALPANRIEVAVARVLQGAFREAMEAIESRTFFARKDFINIRFPIPLDEEGLREAVLLHERLLESIAAAAERARVRLSRGGESIEATAAILLFEIPGPRWDLPMADDDLLREPLRRRSNQRRFDAVVALVDPLRVRIVDALSIGPASVAELAERTGAPLERIRYEVRALERAGMVKVHSRRESRGAMEKVLIADNRRMTFFADDVPDPAQVPGDWAAWWVRLVFGDALAALRAGSFRRDADWHLARLPMRLDPAGFAEISALMDEALETLFDLREECLTRLGASVPPYVVCSDLLLFERNPLREYA